MRGWVAGVGLGAVALVVLVPVIANDYPIDDGRGGNGFSNEKATTGTWTGGTIPDERSFLGWSQIYWETGHLWLPQSQANMQAPPGPGGPPPGGKPPPRPPTSIVGSESDTELAPLATANGKYDVPQVSTTVTMDGERGFANHWPAAQSVYLIPFYLTGTTLLATLLPLAGATYATWWLAHRWGGPWAGPVAGTAFLATGLVAMTGYQRLMADLPSACFLAMGMALVVATADRCKNRQTQQQWMTTWALAGVAGFLLGWAVLVRLTAVLGLVGPAAFLLTRLIQQRRVPGHAMRLLLAAAPAIVMLAILGGWLMWYNAEFFGSITASGYGEQGSAGRSFDATTDDVSHFLETVAPRLLVLAPILLAAVPALLGVRKRLDQAALLLGWGLPVYVFYAQLGWVGRIGWEDMRYFLPAVPAAAVAFGLAASHAARHRQARWLLAGALVLLVVVGLWASSLAIDFQTSRMARAGPPPSSEIPGLLSAAAWLSVVLAWAAMLWRFVARPKPVAAATRAVAAAPASVAGVARPAMPGSGPRSPPGPAPRAPRADATP